MSARACPFCDRTYAVEFLATHKKLCRANPANQAQKATPTRGVTLHTSLPYEATCPYCSAALKGRRQATSAHTQFTILKWCYACKGIAKLVMAVDSERWRIVEVIETPHKGNAKSEDGR